MVTFVQLMLRYVDDFLFISKRRDLATQFLRTMNDGEPIDSES